MLKTWLNSIFTDDSITEGYFPAVSSNPGSRLKDERILKDRKGVMELETVGQSDLQEYINSHADSVDINKMLERYKSGDLSALDRVKASYLDLLGAPKSLAEMYSFVANTSAYFDTLPLEVRKEYDFNVANFVADIGSERYMKLFTPKMSDVEEVKVAPEVAAKVEKDIKIENEVKADA